MRHPQFAPARRVVATVPALCDGLNVGTAPFLIGDRQCADSQDMWWKDGALRCREGFSTTKERVHFEYADDTTCYFTDADGYILALTSGDYESGADVSLCAYDPNGNTTGVWWSQNANRGFRGCLAPTGGTLQNAHSALLFLSDGTLMGIKASQNRFVDITEEAYVPLRMANGVPAPSHTQTALSGDLLEGNNLLTSHFRCTFTTDGSGVYYYLPTVSERSTLKVTLYLDSVYRTWELSGDDVESALVAGLKLHFNRTTSCFWLTKEDGTPHPIKAGDSRNNLTVLAQHSCRQSGLPYVMKFGTWFGGTAGGTRLFLGGDKDGYIAWSDLNNPLYFPESNYALVGTPGKPVTAFGKQGTALVLFKETEIYAAEYTAVEKITAENVQNGEVTDITATATFPVTALHSEIGCDLPKTVALCGNRLWWACRDGSVYALQSTGQFSQRNITRLSAPIEPLLRKNGAPKFSGASVRGERYYLLWNDSVFVTETDDTPAWYRFSTAATNAQPVSVFVKDNVLFLPAAYHGGDMPMMAMFLLRGAADTRLEGSGANVSAVSVPIRGSVCTKQYDFGTPEKRKTVTRVFAEATATSSVSVSYVTERGEIPDLPHPSRAVEGLSTTPRGVRCRRLGVKFSGEGLCLGSVTVRLTEQT